MLNKYLFSDYTIRFGDCDPFRHLNNARYIDYFLNAREDHLLEHYQMDLAEFARKGQSWVVKEHGIAYLKPAVYNERVSIGSALLVVSADHLLVEMMMLNESRQHLKAIMHTTFVPVNLVTGKKEPHTPALMEFLEDKLLAPEEKMITDHRQRATYWQQQLKAIKAL